ncbi:HET-domain-containing protein, partial [Eremomyces bilateralis CBS 781.70]
MRLINARTLHLEDFFGPEFPPYAILSHTWCDEEVSLQDWQDPEKRTASTKGAEKIRNACKQTLTWDLEYIWVDTNCIDKSSSAELSEAINSMYMWYRDSHVCFTFLEDFEWAPEDGQDPLVSLSSSRWFTRGWTLQELIAPGNLVFFDKRWAEFGTKLSMGSLISQITGIRGQYLQEDPDFFWCSVAERMSWLASRSTTRPEDMAYCMLGLFNINMPLLYGEGSKAFLRLQEEIIKVSNDHTMFCWSWTPAVPIFWRSFLAPSPAVFKNCGQFVATNLVTTHHAPTSTFHITSVGLRITLPL